MKAKKTKKPFQTKYIFVTGGVVSSVGKGLTAASLGALLEARGIFVSMMKFDPYINVDPGTMSPFQHGEVYVTEDGAETDLDLGHYERFTSLSLSRSHSVSTGQIYEAVINRERRGEYLGATVQVIPHITDEIKSRVKEASSGAEVAIIEIGGTVGDIESLPFLESIRQMRTEVGYEDSVLIHVTYVPYIAAAGELKSKPTQHSVKELQQLGLQPDFLICRSEKAIDPGLKEKIALFCSVRPENVIGAADSKSIYEVPLNLAKEKLDELVTNRLKVSAKKADLSGWKKINQVVNEPERTVRIAVVGKYVNLKESYKSLHESMVHGGIANHARVEVFYVDSEKLTDQNLLRALEPADGILVPGGFGARGIEGKMKAIRYARENQIPFFGICYGMQLAAVEFAQNVCGIKNPTSREWVPNDMTPSARKKLNLIIDLMADQEAISDKGGTMRLGAYACRLEAGSLTRKIYGRDLIYERHRHRFEFNNSYREIFEKKGLHCVGVCPERNLVEILELESHPWFIGVQFHPEFKSKPLEPHPLFRQFIQASLRYQRPAQKDSKMDRKKASQAGSSAGAKQ